MIRQPRPTNSDQGSVVAEFVLVLPVVILIMAITLGSLALQIERQKMVTVASAFSRGIARGEPLEKLRQVFQRQLEGRTFRLFDRDQLACVELGAELQLPGLGGLPLSIGDTECARKLGL